MSSEAIELFETNAPLSLKKRDEFRDCLITCIEEVLSFSKVVLNFLELNTPFRKAKILEKAFLDLLQHRQQELGY